MRDFTWERNQMPSPLLLHLVICVLLARLECRVSSHSGRPVCGSLQVASPHLQQCDRMWKSDLNKGLVCLPRNLSLVWGATKEGGSLSLGGGWVGSGAPVEKASCGRGSGH